MHCYGMLQALALVSHYQLQLYYAAGAALVFLLGLVIQKVVNMLLVLTTV